MMSRAEVPDAQDDRLRSFERVLHDIKTNVLNGLRSGDRIPGVRELSARYRASPVTVQRALRQLTLEGRVVTRPGHGTFVAPAERTMGDSGPDLGWQSVSLGGRASLSEDAMLMFQPAQPDAIPLGTGYLDEQLQPLDALQRAMTRAARRPGLWSRAGVAGLEPLRAWFAQEIGGGTLARDVMIVPGGQAALSTIFRALVQPGAALLVESPTYFGALAIAQSAGIRAVPVPTDADGLRPELLEAAFGATGARAVYVQPLYANPTGSVLSDARRAAVLEIAARAGAFVIEDDYARDFALDGTPAPPMFLGGAGRVVYVRSLTKPTAPGLRVTAIAALGPVMARLRAARAVDDFFLSSALQEVALELVTNIAWPRHLRALRLALRSRRDAALGALARHAPSASQQCVPKGGFNLWLELPEGTDESGLVLEMGRAGVQISGGRGFFPAEPTGSFLRLSYASSDESAIQEGVRRIGVILESRVRQV